MFAAFDNVGVLKVLTHSICPRTAILGPQKISDHSMMAQAESLEATIYSLYTGNE